MKTAVFYGRYSSANQNEQSIEGQRHVCERFAAEHDIYIVGEYIDRALSGTSDKRPQFQQMIADSSGVRFVTVSVCVYIRRVADNSRLSNCINVSFHFVQVYKLYKMYHLGLTNDTRCDII